MFRPGELCIDGQKKKILNDDLEIMDEDKLAFDVYLIRIKSYNNKIVLVVCSGYCVPQVYTFLGAHAFLTF